MLVKLIGTLIFLLSLVFAQGADEDFQAAFEEMLALAEEQEAEEQAKENENTQSERCTKDGDYYISELN